VCVFREGAYLNFISYSLHAFYLFLNTHIDRSFFSHPLKNSTPSTTAFKAVLLVMYSEEDRMVLVDTEYVCGENTEEGSVDKENDWIGDAAKLKKSKAAERRQDEVQENFDAIHQQLEEHAWTNGQDGKVIHELTPGYPHLTAECWKDFSKSLRSNHPGWKVKQRLLTDGERDAVPQKELRKGKMHKILVIYNATTAEKKKEPPLAEEQEEGASPASSASSSSTKTKKNSHAKASSPAAAPRKPRAAG
jgi:hypothetical protein